MVISLYFQVEVEVAWGWEWPWVCVPRTLPSYCLRGYAGAEVVGGRGIVYALSFCQGVGVAQWFEQGGGLVNNPAITVQGRAGASCFEMPAGTAESVGQPGVFGLKVGNNCCNGEQADVTFSASRGRTFERVLFDWGRGVFTSGWGHSFGPVSTTSPALLTTEPDPSHPSCQPPQVRITAPDPNTFSFVITVVNGIGVAVPAGVERQAGPIHLTATTEGTGQDHLIQWRVSGDGVALDPPELLPGANVQFIPAAIHPAYAPGTGGSETPSPPLRYKVTASYKTASASIMLEQRNIRDIIVQEYVNHSTITDPRNGLTVDRIPSQSDIVTTQSVEIFTADIINQWHNYGAYNVVIGNPAQLAQQVLDEYNRRIYDDVQVVPVGTTVASADTVVVGPGQSVNGFGPILDTQPEGDDQIVGNSIVAGPNLIAETHANNNNGQPTNFRLALTSAWRNPERNERASGVINSRHQFGDAVDLQPIGGSVPGKTQQQLYCILETAHRENKAQVDQQAESWEEKAIKMGQAPRGLCMISFTLSELRGRRSSRSDPSLCAWLLHVILGGD